MLLSAKRGYFYRSIAIEMGGVSRYFSKVSGSGVDLTLLIHEGVVHEVDLKNWKRETDLHWETKFCPVMVLGGLCALPMRVSNPSPILDQNRAPIGPDTLSSVGPGCGGIVLEHCQTPTRSWINFFLRVTPNMSRAVTE